jgi:hypothetical protein
MLAWVYGTEIPGAAARGGPQSGGSSHFDAIPLRGRFG